MTLQEYNDLYKLPILKSMTITSSGGMTITNTNIVSEKMSLEKSLCSEDNLRYGRCEAACFKITIADISHDFTGEWLNAVQTIKTDGDGYLLTENGSFLTTEDGKLIQLTEADVIECQAVLGRFKAYSDKPTNDRRWRELTCYDAMYDILNADVAAWYNNLTFPMTIKNFRDSFFTYLGITQETVTLCNDSFVTQGGFSVSGSLSGKTVIEAICELNGCFGQITPTGTFDYVSLIDAPTLTLDYYVDGSGTYEDYTTAYITGINARGTDNDVGTFVGTDANVYLIENNPLIYGTEGTTALENALTALLDHVKYDSFRPFTVQTYGNPMLPLGTRLTIVTRNMTIVSNVITKNMTGIQGLRDKYEAKSEKNQPSLVNNTTSEIKRTAGKTHELEVNVDGLTSRVTSTETNLSTNYSTTTQTQSLIQTSASNILSQVSSTYVTQTTYNAEIQNLQDQIDGRIETYDGNVIPTLNNAPANAWTTDAMKNSHVGDLYRYHYTEQGVDKTDYYRFDKDTSTSPPTYSWVTLGQSDVDEALRLANEANEKADAAQAQLDALENDIDDNYSTTTQMNSAIQQSANSIEATVSEAVSKYDTSGLGYTIDIYGYGQPSTTQYPPALHTNEYYLDNNSGQVYKSNGTAWATQGSPLTLITTNISTEVTQTKNTYVVKHKNNDELCYVQLGTDAESGTAFKIKAKNIEFIALDQQGNGTINLTTNNLIIDSTYFKVSKTGALKASSGTIGGWSMNNSMLYKEVDDNGTTYRPYLNAPNNPDTSSLAFGIRKQVGSQDPTFPFRVNYSGQLIATNANISGTITTADLTATGGTIGGWTINATQIRKEVTVTEGDTSVTYRPMLNAPDNPSAGNIAFGVVKTVGSNPNTYPFRVNYDGAVTATNLTATGGAVGGWTITSGKIYGGDSSTGVAVMQKPAANITWTFASGGTSHSNYGNCPFRVDKAGHLVSSWIAVSDSTGDYGTIVLGNDVLSLTQDDIRLIGSTGNYVFNASSYQNAVWTQGDFYCYGTKSRIAETEDYGKRALYCYETPSPMFGDVGEGKIAEDGKCYVWLDSTFSETIKTESYQVFLQKYGQGECYVTERTQRYFVVEGTVGMRFGWEIKARQAGFENLRLETVAENQADIRTINYGAEAIKHFNELSEERSIV